MKIIELLLDNLPERYVDAVVNNLSDRNILNEDASDISAELLTLFDWEQSREGYEFWSEVLDSIILGKDLPPLPIEIEYEPNLMFLDGDTMHIMNSMGMNIVISFSFELKNIKNIPAQKREKILAFLN